MARVFRLLTQLLDVNISTPQDGDGLSYDAGTDKWVNAAGGSGGGTDDQTAAEVPFTPAGTIAATDTQSAVEEVATDAAAAVAALSAVYQPLDSDLTSIAALSTTSFGRGLLILANQAALLSAAGAAAASHVHAGEDITSGTVADARIASTITRDSEVTSAISALSSVYQPLDSDLTSIAALSTTSFGRGLLILADQAALLSAAGAAAASHTHAESDVTNLTTDLAGKQPLDSDLTAIAALSPTNDDVVQRKAGAWTNRTIAQLLTDMAAAGTTFQPLDSDLTSIAALTTTSFGRSLLTLADAAALLSASGATTAAAALTAALTEIADQKRVVEILVSDPGGSAITTGDGKAYFRVPTLLNGHNLVSVGASVSTVSSSGIPTVQLRRMRLSSATAQSAADMLSTKLTVDATEFDSKDATTAAVIDTSNDDVQTGDQINVDIDVAGTGAKGLVVTMTFEAP